MELHIVSDGVFKTDAGTMFARFPRANWDGVIQVDRKHRTFLSLNCLLIILETRQGETKRILVNTGIGQILRQRENVQETYSPTPSRLAKALRELGLMPRDIHFVVLTDLGFLEAGGCIRMDRSGKSVLTFPNAIYITQEAALRKAITRSIAQEEIPHICYESVILPLVEAERLTLLQENWEIFPGIRLIQVKGPSQGQQIVVIERGADRVIFPAGIMPTVVHFSNPECVSSLDQEPEITRQWKRQIIEVAAREGYRIVFPHGLASSYTHRNTTGNAGDISQNREGRYMFQEVKL